MMILKQIQMKTQIQFLIPAILLTSCTTLPIAEPPQRNETYQELYQENPRTILILPPNNYTSEKKATRHFYPALFAPLADAGYYVIPPLATLWILEQENLNDTILNNQSLKLGELFGVDMILHTNILQWEKSYGLDAGEIIVEAEFLITSAKTGKDLFYRRTYGSCHISAEVEGSKFLTFIASAARTASLTVDDIAMRCSRSSFFDLPRGPYSSGYQQDGDYKCGPPSIRLQWGNNNPSD
jgi:hypothetical protein